MSALNRHSNRTDYISVCVLRGRGFNIIQASISLCIIASHSSAVNHGYSLIFWFWLRSSLSIPERGDGYIVGWLQQQRNSEGIPCFFFLSSALCSMFPRSSYPPTHACHIFDYPVKPKAQPVQFVLSYTCYVFLENVFILPGIWLSLRSTI